MERLTDLFFPARCVCCHQKILDANNPYLCPGCQHKTQSLVLDRVCHCCGTPAVGPKKMVEQAGEGHYCGDCLTKPPNYVMARSLFLYRGPIKTLVQQLKYRKTSSALATMTDILTSMRWGFDDCDIVVPVPLHPKKLRERGFNQSLLLAKMFFSEKTSEIRPDLLKRVRNTPPQASLPGLERRRNLEKAFAVPSDTCLEGKVVCIVDDVFTTGTTVNECSLVLNTCGAKVVKVLTFARSPFT